MPHGTDMQVGIGVEKTPCTTSDIESQPCLLPMQTPPKVWPNNPLSAYASAPPDVTAAAPNVITDMRLVTLVTDPQFRGAQGE